MLSYPSAPNVCNGWKGGHYEQSGSGLPEVNVTYPVYPPSSMLIWYSALDWSNDSEPLIQAYYGPIQYSDGARPHAGNYQENSDGNQVI